MYMSIRWLEKVQQRWKIIIMILREIVSKQRKKINRIVLPDHIGGDDHLINYDSLYTTMLTEMESDEDNLYMYPFEGFYYGNHAVEAVKNEGYWFGE